MKKKKVLIIFKYPRGHWNIPVINQLSIYYETEYVYISDYKNKNFTEITNEINNLIKVKNIEIVIFDADYFKFINFFFIDKINSKKKILLTGDDFELHEIHSVTVSACDLVLTACPLSVLKYKEKGYQAQLIHFENDPKFKINKKSDLEKEIDVLFFGDLTPDRRDILDYIAKEGINLKNVGHDKITPGVSDEELLKLISKSKIIINLSKSRTISVKNYPSESVYKFYYQFKARVITAGINRIACVSEYSPGQELLFEENEIATFYTKEQCVKLLKKFLSNNNLLEEYTKKFSDKVYEQCKFDKIYEAIEKPNIKKIKLIKIPYWYLRISAKQIILRNIKLSNLVKVIFQFGVIIEMVRNTNIFVKFFVLSETLLNALWYSFILTIKPKK